MADVTIGARLQLDANDGIKSLKDLKNQIREAKGDLVGMTQEFGATSEQARMAAKRVAELEDNLGDAKKLVDAFNPDQKFRALGQALNGVLGGFTALTGAMGLLGVESAEVQKQLLKVQSALALSQGLNQIGESINSFKNLGKTIVATLGKSGLIGVAIAGVAALGAALLGVFKGSSKLTEQQKILNDVNKEVAATLSREIVQYDRLFSSLNDSNVSLSRKKQIVNDIHKQFPETERTLKIENGLVKGQAEAYNQVTAAIQKKAIVDAAQTRLAKEIQPLFEAGLNMGLKAEQFTLEYLKKFNQQTGGYLTANIQRIELLQKLIGDNNITGGTTSGTTTTPGGRSAEKETKEQELIYSTYADNALQRDIDFRNKFIENRRLFIEAGRALEEAEFNEKIALLNLELDAEEAAAKRKEQLEQLNFETKQKFLSATANLLSSLSTLIGEQTAAGKVFAVAEATINTYAAIAGSLRAFAGKPIPGYAIIQAIATGIFGLAQVKKILSVPVPGKGGAGGVAPSISSISAPIQAQSPLSQRTRLDDESLNQIGNATVRAFVVESDVTNNQERIRRLNRAARIA